MTTPAPGPELHALAVRLGELADTTARQVMDLLDQLTAGLIRPDQLPELVAILVKLGGDQAAALAVSELVRDLALVAPRAALPSVTGVTGHVQTAAVERAVGTVMAGAEHTRRRRLEQLARGAVARAGQDARGDLVRKSTLVSGWTRGLDSDSCELCGWWWREGRVWPKSHHMPRHPGCTCVQVPVVSRDVRGLSREAYDDSAERRELERSGAYMDAFGTNRRGQTTPAMRARAERRE